MATRGAIARETGEGKFTGVYQHWDSYPAGLGHELWDLYHGHFAEDLEQMLAVLIDDHPGGWSSISATNFPQGSEAYGTANPWEVTEQNAAGSGVEYAYVFNTSLKQMIVLSSQRQDGSKMIGMFGSGDAEAYWTPIAFISLSGDEPDWDAMGG